MSKAAECSDALHFERVHILGTIYVKKNLCMSALVLTSSITIVMYRLCL